MFYPLNYEGKVTQKYEKKMSILYNVLNQNGKRIQNQKVYGLEYPDKESKNNTCASYSQNLGEVCTDYG